LFRQLSDMKPPGEEALARPLAVGSPVIVRAERRRA
jgi:hypothetical protein